MHTRSLPADYRTAVEDQWATAPRYPAEVEILSRRASLPGHRRWPDHRVVRRGRLLPAAIAVAGCELAGMAAVVAGYHIAESNTTSASEFAWFWVGMLLLTIPLAVLVARRNTSSSMRMALLVLYGFVTYAPKLLRNPASPVYHDEYAHWLQTFNILTTGKLFTPNPIIGIIARYPGLHAATAGLVGATGLSIWQAATLLLLLSHVALVIGIAELGRALGFDNRTAALVAILYSCNSSFFYFDTQYAYESLAVTMAVWVLVSFVRAICSRSRQEQGAWLILTITLAAGTVITHHLSALILVVIMTLISLALSLPWLAHREQWIRIALTAWGTTLSVAIMAGAWVYFIAPATLSYLSPYVGKGLSQLLTLAEGSGGGRQLFGASLSPKWEQKSAYLVILLATVLAAGGLLLIRMWIKNRTLPRGRHRALLFAFTALGLAYFPSILFILSPSGAEGARRTWTFTWIGLSVLAAPVVVWLLDRAGRQFAQWRRACARAVLVSALAIGLIGGTAAGINAAYRFPGPYLYGSDTRSITPEVLGASRWFSTQLGPGHNIVTDKYTGLIFGSFGQQFTDVPSPGFPVWDLYLDKPGAQIGPARLIFELTISHYTYLVVDNRIAHEVPAEGQYFGNGEPGSLITRSGKAGLPAGRLGKFDAVPWMIKVFQSDNYSVYRLNLPPSKVQSGSPPGTKPRSTRHHRPLRHHPLPQQGRFLVSG
jgi:hypothetical protein